MSFRFKHIEKVVGLFMLVGIIILLVTIIFMGREQKWFQTKIKFSTVFDDGDNLSKGMDVKVNGLVVGRTTGISFSTNNKIMVSFIIYKEYIDKVRSDSYVFKESSSPLGGGYLLVTLGTKSGKKVDKGATLFSQDSTKVQDLLADDLIPQKKSSFDKIIKNVNLLMSQLASPKGPLLGSLKNIKQLSGWLAAPGGSLNKLISGKMLYNKIEATLTTVQKMTRDLQVLTATLRLSAPNVRNIITGAEKGLSETTKVMRGIQQYFNVRTRHQKMQKNNTPTAVIKIDRRSRDY